VVDRGRRTEILAAVDIATLSSIWNNIVKEGGNLAAADGVFDAITERFSLAALQRIEQNEGVVKGNFSTVLKIQNALEEAGIRFTDDGAGEIGVRLQTGKR
jgi:hypothetical protein